MKRRPDNWAPELVLGYLRNNPDSPLAPWLRKIGDTFDIDPRNLQLDIRAWQKTDPGFREEYVRLQNARGKPLNRTTPVGIKAPIETRPGMEDVEDRFLEAFLRHGKRTMAAAEASVNWSTVSNWLKPSSPAYRPEFAKRFKNARDLRLAIDEDQYQELIEMAREEGDVRTAGYLLLQRLRASSRDWQVTQRKVHEGTVKHDHRLREKKVAALDRARRINARLLPVLTGESEAEVVDLPAEDVEEADAAAS